MQNIAEWYEQFEEKYQGILVSLQETIQQLKLSPDEGVTETAVSSIINDSSDLVKSSQFDDAYKSALCALLLCDYLEFEGASNLSQEKLDTLRARALFVKIKALAYREPHNERLTRRAVVDFHRYIFDKIESVDQLLDEAKRLKRKLNKEKGLSVNDMQALRILRQKKMFFKWYSLLYELPLVSNTQAILVDVRQLTRVLDVVP